MNRCELCGEDLNADGECSECGSNLFTQPPSPPTGPLADDYSHEDGRTPAFWKFFNSDEGEPFWEVLQLDALDALYRGEKRFSTRTFLAKYRDDNKVRVNDHFSPWFADMLVAKYPQLLDIVERRKRRKPSLTELPPEEPLEL